MALALALLHPALALAWVLMLLALLTSLYHGQVKDKFYVESQNYEHVQIITIKTIATAT
jgi:hypothetical protein